MFIETAEGSSAIELVNISGVMGGGINVSSREIGRDSDIIISVVASGAGGI